VELLLSQLPPVDWEALRRSLEQQQWRAAHQQQQQQQQQLLPL
jgi:hypothetical protein